MMWFFFGVMPLGIIIEKIIKIKNEAVAARIIMILYFSVLTVAIHWYNPHYIIVGFVLCTAGIILNWIVMAINNGKMPACVSHKIIDTHIYVEMKKVGQNKTKLNFLGDWIPSHGNYYLSSPGDYLINIGPMFSAAEIFFFF